MKHIVALFLFAIPAAAATWDFTIPKDGEVGLTITASVPETGWSKQGAEAVVLTLKVDGKYNQDVTLYMGAVSHDYKVLLGPLAKGRHKLAYERNEIHSATLWGHFKTSFRAEVVDDPALARAPLMYYRPDAIDRFSDIPLLAWYEWLNIPEGRVLQFSMIFSNEDGGTDTEALMARWGRTLDIEYVYRWREGASDNGTYQAKTHKETPFHGEMIGQHPVIYDVTDNNNFSDAGDAIMRVILWPQRFDLSQHSREELADQNPWTYQIMAEELTREGKVEKLGDPRGYLYIEAKIEAVTAAASFNVGDAKSDRDLPRLRINRDGWVRTAIKMENHNVPRVEFRCHAPTTPRPESFCKILAISKVFFLDKDYRPQTSVMEWRGPEIRLAPGEGTFFTPTVK